MCGLVVGCTVKDPPPVEGKWVEDFERTEIGANYRPTADNYSISNGSLSAKGAFNHPLWLRKKLPANAVIELDCWSNSADGDIKVELYGDGSSYAKDKGQYTSTGYVAVFGGWNNSKSILAKGNEHGKEIASRTQPKVEVGKHYHWKLVRQGGKLDWFIDDMEQPFLSLEDPAPLSGSGHAYFGINNWQSDSWFDNVTITPL
jgi:hypothetical protein